ncbi:MAG TPA: M6 family metalloprotease domain-containing protein [Humisphaera sp.]
MTRRPLLTAVVAALSFAGVALADSAPATKPSSAPTAKPAATRPAELPGFRTVATAQRAKAKSSPATASNQVGYLGMSVALKDGKPVVDLVDPKSPAADAGLAIGDVVLKVNGDAVSGPVAVRDELLSLPPGSPVAIVVGRDGQERELKATLVPASRPMKLSPVRAIMGVQLKDVADGDGAEIARTTPDQPAEKAGLKAGDVILRLDDAPVGATSSINELLAGYGPGDEVVVRYRRDGRPAEAKVTLTADPRSVPDTRAFVPSQVFKKDVYRLGVICVQFPDAKPNEKVKAKDWEDMLFSTGTYTDKSVTGQPVFGSLNDYYREVSCGRLRVEGKVFDWVTAAKNRADYGAGSGDRRLLNEGLELLQKREGADVIKGFDGFLFLYAGGRVQTNRGNVFWPHKGLVIHQNRRLTYFICPDGGDRQSNISTFVHEFGHMLGLPDLYARPENPGSEGLGQWCLMSNQLGNGRPQHMSAWCKEQLGWLAPAVIDPGVKQKLVLSPVNGTTDQCFKVLARADGSEYFLLEVRKRTGFDADLPGEGLLVWRVVRGRPILEESHGVDGPLGPRSYLRSVPFPTASNRSFTPFTTPSSRPQLGGGTPVFITEIERLPDGRVSFCVGYETY